MCDRTLAIYDELLAETGRGRVARHIKDQ